MTIQELNQVLESTINEIDSGLESGELTAEQAQAFKAQALNEYNEYVTEELDLDDEDGDEGAESSYSSNRDLAQFAGSDSGLAILQLAEVDYDGDLEAAIYDISVATGYEPKVVVGLIDGTYIPTPELKDQIASVVPSAQDPEVYEEFQSLDSEAYEDESDEDGDEGAEYSAFQRQLAQFQRQNAELEARVNQAEFEKSVTTSLNQLERYADRLVHEGSLPPVAYNHLMGEFESSDDRLAAFSEMCTDGGIDAVEQLARIQYALEVFEKCGPVAQFSQVAKQKISRKEQELQEEIDSTVNATHDLWKKNGSSLPSVK